MSVLQKAKPLCWSLQIKSPKTTISLFRTSQKQSLTDKSRISILLAAFESVVFESITVAVVSRRESNPHRGEVFVSINLSLPQDTHKNTILKARLDTGTQGNTAPDAALSSNVSAQPRRSWKSQTRFLVILGCYPHRLWRLTNQAPRYCYHTLFLQRGTRSNILLCDRHPRPSNHRPPDFHRLEAGDT